MGMLARGRGGRLDRRLRRKFGPGGGDLVITTHPCTARDFHAALRAFEGLRPIAAPPAALPIADASYF